MANVDMDKLADQARKALVDDLPKPEEKPTVPKKNLKATPKKKSVVDKINDSFFATDIKEIISYGVREIIIPETRDLIFNLFTSSFEKLLWGDSNPASNRGNFRNNHTPYNSLSSRNKPKTISSINRKSIEDYVFESRRDAEDALSYLCDRIEQAGFVTVDDYYEILGKTGTFQDRKWGWTNLNRADIRKTNGGYILSLPGIEAL